MQRIYVERYTSIDFDVCKVAGLGEYYFWKQQKKIQISHQK